MRSTFRSKLWREIGASGGPGRLRSRPGGDKLALEFRTLRLTLVYQGERRSSAGNPLPTAPQISVRFSKQEMGEPPKLFVALNFDEGDPVEVFTRVR